MSLQSENKTAALSRVISAGEEDVGMLGLQFTGHLDMMIRIINHGRG